MRTNTLITLSATAALALSGLAGAQPSGHQTQAIVVQPTPGHGGGHGQGLNADIWIDRDTYFIGEEIDVHFRTNRDSYVYIYNTDSRGVTTQIFPNFYDQDNYVRGNSTYTIPERGYTLRVAGPTGFEQLEIYAVTDDSRVRNQLHTYDARTPFAAVTPRTEAALQSLVVQPTPNPPSQRLIVVEPRPQPQYDTDRESISFEVCDLYRPPANLTGDLRIHSTLNHVAVYIDGNFAGYAPDLFLDLTPGYHDIELTRSGYRTQREQVYVQAGRTAHLTVNMRRGSRGGGYGGGYPVPGSWFSGSLGNFREDFAFNFAFNLCD